MEPRSRASHVIQALRRVNLEGSVFGQTVAIRFGLSESDVEALERLAEIGTTSAGRLGELMGLSSGAITRVLDRLEQAGYIRRETDPTDRRRVVVTLIPGKAAAIDALTERFARASEAELARYTADQLDAIADFLGRMSEVTRDQTDALRGVAGAAGGAGGAGVAGAAGGAGAGAGIGAGAEAGSAGPGAPAGSPAAFDFEGGEHSAPRGGLTAARFHLRGGANELTLAGGSAPMAELYRAEFTGPVPQVRLRNGVVSVQYRGGRPWDWRRRTSVFRLNPGVAWDASISGGGSRISVAAEAIDLRSFELTGGVDRLSLSLGRPRGEVAVRINGGAHELSLDRPAGVPVLVRVKGGAARVDFDGQRMIAAGSADLASTGAAGSSDRITLEISGGVAGLTVSERR